MKSPRGHLGLQSGGCCGASASSMSSRKGGSAFFPLGASLPGPSFSLLSPRYLNWRPGLADRLPCLACFIVHGLACRLSLQRPAQWPGLQHALLARMPVTFRPSAAPRQVSPLSSLGLRRRSSSVYLPQHKCHLCFTFPLSLFRIVSFFGTEIHCLIFIQIL